MCVKLLCVREQLHRIRQRGPCYLTGKPSTLYQVKNKEAAVTYSVSSCRLTHDGSIVGIKNMFVTDLKALGLTSMSLRLNENHHSVYYENKVPKTATFLLIYTELAAFKSFQQLSVLRSRFVLSRLSFSSFYLCIVKK